MKIRYSKYLLALTGLLGASCIFAQTSVTKYAGHINVGAPFGDNKPNIIIQTIHGIRYNTWFAGIGGGLDAYYLQSLPVFFNIRKNIMPHPSTPFVYADAGINYTAEGEGQASGRGSSMKRKPGAYYEFGAGYRVDLKSNAVNFTIGHSYKGYREYYYGIRQIPNREPEENALLEKKSFDLRRLSFKIGFEF